jgi:4-amino-4-deoxy-L-arabinose transferase-like glycosyltransferase
VKALSKGRLSRGEGAVILLLWGAALALRVYQLGEIPAGLYCDEAANGYNAYSLLQFGEDEHGESYPLFIWSFLAFKYPLYIYPTMLWTGLFGLTEFSTRLQAALYGSGGVVVAFLIGRTFFNSWVGFTAAILTAIVPWNFHFSRIAFSLIGLPFWFGLGVLFLGRAIGVDPRRRDWILAGTCLALCFYSYAIAQVVVPAFVLCAIALNIDVLWRRLGGALLAVISALLVLLPFVIFFGQQEAADNYYKALASFLWDDFSWQEKLRRIFVINWPQYYDLPFLVERGDPLVRHGVRDHGALLPAMLPAVVGGAVVAMLSWNRPAKLLVIWLLIYPLGAAMARETPSASRAILGALILPILGGVGIGTVLSILQRLPRVWLRVPTTAAVVIFLTVKLVPESHAYLRHYFIEYSNYAAPGIGGFQYGYRDVFRLMESQRRDDDLLVLSSTAVQQPQIFSLFYTGRRPALRTKWTSGIADYFWVRPIDVQHWYGRKPNVLFTVLPIDLFLFESWNERTDIHAPGGQLAFTVLRNPVPKNFIVPWELIGPFDNPENRNRHTVMIDPMTMEPQQPILGNVKTWRRIAAPNGVVDLNDKLAAEISPRERNIEFASATLRTTLHATRPQLAQLEAYGSGDELFVWVNGLPATPEPLLLNEIRAANFPIELVEGDNTLLVKTNETVGDWWFVSRVTTADGNPARDVSAVPFRSQVPN